MADLLSQRFQKNPNMIFRKIADTQVLIPIHHNVTDMEAIYELEGVAAYIWESLDGERDGYQILQGIVAHYEVTPELAQQDLIEYLEQLLAAQAVIVV